MNSTFQEDKNRNISDSLNDKSFANKLQDVNHVDNVLYTYLLNYKDNLIKCKSASQTKSERKEF